MKARQSWAPWTTQPSTRAPFIHFLWEMLEPTTCQRQFTLTSTWSLLPPLPLVYVQGPINGQLPYIRIHCGITFDTFWHHRIHSGITVYILASPYTFWHRRIHSGITVYILAYLVYMLTYLVYILAYLNLYYPILSYPILYYPILSYPILYYPILSYTILSYAILSYNILSYPII